MYKFAVCDDNRAFAEQVAETIKKYGERCNIELAVFLFDDSDQLMDLIEARKLYDVYFLDIEMPCHSGIDLAKKIREASNMALVVLLTAYDNYAVEACGLNVVRYLLKDRREQELEGLLDELMFRLAQVLNDKIYVISNQRKYMKLMQRDIVYIYKRQKNAVIVMRDGTEETERLSLQDVYQKLENDEMVYLDRGVILNLLYVERVNSDKIVLSGGHEIIASAGHTSELKKMLSEYWRNIL